MDVASLFSLGGAPPNQGFPAGQTGCAFAGAPGAPNSAALDPARNLWVGFGKSSMILRFNSPATVTANTFGTCDQFMQQAATVAGNHSGTGLTFVGHDLWGATLEIMYTIKNADTVCLVGQNPACSSANGTAQIVLPTIIGATAITSDQAFPATNGNNLYIGMPNTMIWLGNVAGGPAGQTLAPTYIDPSAGVTNLGCPR